jgi:hypothetical protein
MEQGTDRDNDARVRPNPSCDTLDELSDVYESFRAIPECPRFHPLFSRNPTPQFDLSPFDSAGLSSSEAYGSRQIKTNCFKIISPTNGIYGVLIRLCLLTSL